MQGHGGVHPFLPSTDLVRIPIPARLPAGRPPRLRLQSGVPPLPQRQRSSLHLALRPHEDPPSPPHSPLGLPGNRAQGQEGEALPRDLGRVWGGKRLSWAKKEAEGLPAVRG